MWAVLIKWSNITSNATKKWVRLNIFRKISRIKKKTYVLIFLKKKTIQSCQNWWFPVPLKRSQLWNLKREPLFTFSCILHKKKLLESRKFSTSSFWCIYSFWDVLNTISQFMHNVCVCVCVCVCDKKFLTAPAQKLMNGIAWNFIFSWNLTYIGAE